MSKILTRSTVIFISHFILCSTLLLLAASCKIEKPETKKPEKPEVPEKPEIPEIPEIPTFSVSAEHIYFKAKPEEPVIVTINGVEDDWLFKVDDIENNWLIVIDNKSIDNNTLTITATPNLSSRKRETSIKVISQIDSRTIRIEQEGNIPDSNPPQSKPIVLFSKGHSYYSGDSAGFGIGMHSMVFAQEGAEFTSPGKSYQVSNGIQLKIGLTSDFFKIGTLFRLSEGTYKVTDDNTVAGTITTGGTNLTGLHCSQIITYANGRPESTQNIKLGLLKVKYENEVCIFTFDFTLDDENRFQAEFSGQFQTYNTLLSTLTEDKELKKFSASSILFLGQDYAAGLNLWKISIFSETLSENGNDGYIGSGDVVCAYILTEPETSDKIPEGDYFIDFEDNPLSAISGYTKFNKPQGCHYLKISDDKPVEYAPIQYGRFYVERVENYYLWIMDGYDDRGNHITADYEGRITITQNILRKRK